MAKYKTHSAFNIFLALPATLWALIYFFNPSYPFLIVFILCFIYSTLYMNPYLDLANQIRLFSIRGILTLPFRGYAYIFKHRGISHSFFLGTVSRVAYLGGFFFLILLALDKPFFNQKEFLKILKSEYFIYGFSGILVADFCHLMLDVKRKRS